jgi:cyclopropane fatty-acyl-phospholipid synthase-like methyltransferase
MFQKTDSHNLLWALSRMIDQRWLGLLIKSIEVPVINGVYFPGFPPVQHQIGVGCSGEEALRSAFSFYCEIKRHAANLDVELGPDTRILDFGCGWGRIIRFFLKDVLSHNLYGIDVDSEMISLCQKFLRYGNYAVCNPMPLTTFSDNTFDIIFALSVFSHLAEEFHIKWVEELARILRPGGILVATTQGRHFIEFCRSLRGKKHDNELYNVLAKAFVDTEAALADYDKGKFPYCQPGGVPDQVSSFYGHAVIPQSYIEREWTRYLEFKEFIHDPNSLTQAIAVMQKPFDDSKKHFENSEPKAKTEDIRLNELETRLHFSETALIQRDSHIRSMESLLKEKETTLNNIYNSRGWKALLIFYRVIEKFFPMNTKRRLIAMVIFKTITEPRMVFKVANITNLKKFLYRFGSVEPTSLEKDIEKKTSELPEVNEVGQGVEESNKPYPMFGKTGCPNLMQALSHVIDQKWLDVLIQSIQRPVIDGVELPGFPPDEFQRNSVGSFGETALREIFPFYCGIKRYANDLGLRITKDSHILDFGCGWGRIIRFFLKDVLADNLHGIDVDPEMIGLCKRRVKYGNYSVCNPVPPTEFPGESMDIIYAYSVFSHLAEPVHIKWMEEFSRILKPGGLFIATTRPRSFIEFCQSLRGKKHDIEYFNVLANSFLDAEAALADYDRGKFLYSATGGGTARPGSFYGEAIIPRGYIEREWTTYLEFGDFVDDRSLSFQAMVVMQKPFDDFKKHSEIESKAKTEDIRLDQLKTRLHFLEAALVQRNSHIRSMESLLKEKETTLYHIYNSQGWKALLICCKLGDKILGR